MCDYFTIRQLRMFSSYTIDVKEQAKIDHFLQLLNRSGVAQILDSVKDKNTNMGGRPCYNIYNLFSTILYEMQSFLILIDPHLVTFTELAVLIVFLAFIAASFLVTVP